MKILKITGPKMSNTPDTINDGPTDCFPPEVFPDINTFH